MPDRRFINSIPKRNVEGHGVRGAPTASSLDRAKDGLQVQPPGTLLQCVEDHQDSRHPLIQRE